MSSQGKTAFLFSGQGAQRPGMGRDLYDRSAAARRMFATVSREVSTLCLFGTQQELDRTIHTQPCVLTVDIAAARALIESGVRPEGCAGFSLGEYAALAVGGAYDDATAFSLVERRAQYMQRACDETEGGMMAVIGASAEAVDELCGQVEGVWPVNYNCPGQTVVAGRSEALSRFSALAEENKVRTVELRVSGAFHTQLMASAAEGLFAVLDNTRIRPPTLPVYGNTYAEPYPKDIASVRRILAEQMMRPVRWEATMRRMAADGFTTFIECGPGDTLKGFFKRMKLDVHVSTYQEVLA